MAWVVVLVMFALGIVLVVTAVTGSQSKLWAAITNATSKSGTSKLASAPVSGMPQTGMLA